MDAGFAGADYTQCSLALSQKELRKSLKNRGGLVMYSNIRLAVPSAILGTVLLVSSATAGTLTGVTLFDVPGASSGSTTAYNINNFGTIAGTYLDPVVGYRVFTLSSGVYATVDPAGSVNGSSLVSLNNAGQVVGFSNTSTPPDYDASYLADKGSFSATRHHFAAGSELLLLQ